MAYADFGATSLLQMIMLCFRTFTGQSMSQFAKIHFKPPHMVLAAAGGKAFSLLQVIFSVLFRCWLHVMNSVQPMQQLVQSMC